MKRKMQWSVWKFKKKKQEKNLMLNVKVKELVNTEAKIL